MKGLSVKQPWAWLIVNGLKDVENRTWSTQFRGRIYIHAGSRFSVRDYWYLRSRLISVSSPFSFRAPMPHPDDLTLGAIIGEVDIVDCRDDLRSFWAEEGLWHWILAKPVAYDKPIPYKGQLGLFEVGSVKG